jgi:glycosyltransferase involved in cell wall biosynthesis
MQKKLSFQGAQPVRLAFITMAAPTPDRPMLSQYNLHLAQALRRAGVDVRIVLLSMWMPAIAGRVRPGLADTIHRPSSWTIGGVEFTHVRGVIPHPTSLRWRVGMTSPLVCESLMRLAFAGSLRRLFRSFTPNALLLHDALVMGGLGMSLGQRLGVPVSFIEHDSVQWTRGHRVARYLDSRLAPAAATFGVGWPSVWCLRDICGLKNARFVPNGVIGATSEQRRTPRPAELAGKRVVLCVGAPSPLKGHEPLVRAFARAQTPDALLAIVGNQRPEVEALLNDPVVKPRVHRLPSMPMAELQQWMVWADVFALPSELESFGLVYAEALLAGTPVILTSAAGIASMLTHGEHGWIVTPGDQAGLDRALAEALSARAEQLRRMGEAGRLLFEGRLSWDNAAAAILAGIKGDPPVKGTEVGPAPEGWTPRSIARVCWA